MAKLSLRFRQVFEHPTHFKIIKPMGNPLVIAKKALSPRMQMRLRKFADGGDVTPPVDEPIIGMSDLPTGSGKSPELQQAETAALERGFGMLPGEPQAYEEQALPEPMGAEQILPPPLFGEARIAENTLPEDQKVAGKEDIEQPVAAAIEPQAIEKTQALEIMLPEAVVPGASITGDVFAEAIKLNPQASRSDIAAALLKRISPEASLPQEGIQVAASEPQGKDAVQEFDSALAKYISAVGDEANAKQKSQADLDEVNAKRSIELASLAEKDQKTAEELAARRNTLQKAIDSGFNPTSLWGKMDFGQKVATALSLLVGGVASGLTGKSNVAIDALDKAIERDLEAQKTNFNSLVNQYNRLLNDTAKAESLARADMLDLASLEVERIADRSKGAQIKPAATRLSAELQMKAIENREDVRKKMAQADLQTTLAKYAEGLQLAMIDQRNATAEKERALAEAARRGKLGKAAQPVVPSEASALDVFRAIQDPAKKQKYFVNALNPETGKAVEFIVAPVNQKQAQQEINRRISAVAKIKEALAIIESKPKVLKGADLGKVQAAIGMFWTTFPEASGQGRLLPRQDKDIVKAATLETSLPFVQYANFFDKTRNAFKEFLKQTQEGVKEAITAYGIPGHPGTDELIAAWSKPTAATGQMKSPGIKKIGKVK